LRKAHSARHQLGAGETDRRRERVARLARIGRQLGPDQAQPALAVAQQRCGLAVAIFDPALVGDDEQREVEHVECSGQHDGKRGQFLFSRPARADLW